MKIETLEKIKEFNEKAGLLQYGFKDFKENQYVIEEALEGFDTSYLANKLHIHEDATPKDISRAIVTGCCALAEPIEDVDRLDKILDIIYFSYGAALKLGLSHSQIDRAMDIVCKANLTKLSVGKDEQGKQMKPIDFISPEPKLQKILDERK